MSLCPTRDVSITRTTRDITTLRHRNDRDSSGHESNGDRYSRGTRGQDKDEWEVVTEYFTRRGRETGVTKPPRLGTPDPS